jgi:hypothetical protein
MDRPPIKTVQPWAYMGMAWLERVVSMNYRVFRVGFGLLYPLPYWCAAARRRRADEGQGHYNHFVFSNPIQQFISPIYSPQLCWWHKWRELCCTLCAKQMEQTVYRRTRRRGEGVRRTEWAGQQEVFVVKLHGQRSGAAGGSMCKSVRRRWMSHGGPRFYMCTCAPNLHVHKICCHTRNLKD